MMETGDFSRSHYYSERYLDEKPELSEASYDYKNIGWSLGNECPLNCDQCYSKSARDKGANLSKKIVDRVISELEKLKPDTINFGGNEPIYTNGLNPKESLLPYIIDEVSARGMKIGITTSGLTLIMLEKYFPETLKKINDVDISLDSPLKEEHDKNRGQQGVYDFALHGVEIVKKYGIPRTIIMCAMNWNFTEDRIIKMIEFAKLHDANVRFNPMKPIENKHMDLVLSVEQFYKGLEVVLRYCDPIDLSDPSWASSSGVSKEEVSGCPCGVSSFRIHSISPSGSISISPCVYLHDYKYGDLTKQPVEEIIDSTPFKAFRRRKANPQEIEGCKGCDSLKVCGGGCASRSYLHSMHENGDENRSIFVKDPYCFKDADLRAINLPSKLEIMKSEQQLVHQGYLCTGIFSPKN
ncbi:MAG TPA: radical SAM protein [Spirochaetia bacterium]|nr:radical SAM protein [Spirochaetia bacterium]